MRCKRNLGWGGTPHDRHHTSTPAQGPGTFGDGYQFIGESVLYQSGRANTSTGLKLIRYLVVPCICSFRSSMPTRPLQSATCGTVTYSPWLEAGGVREKNRSDRGSNPGQPWYMQDALHPAGLLEGSPAHSSMAARGQGAAV